MPRSRRRADGPLPDHITKARLVEEIVALLHQREGVTVQRNVRMPSLSDPTQIREIDVLVTGNVAGYPIRIPIECKNYDTRISAGKIGEFRDKLEDVGLPVRNSIFVCVTGFGRDAKRRAADLGIKIFELQGLTPDRLSFAVGQAFQSTVYLLLRVERVNFRSDREHDEIWYVTFLRDRLGNFRGGLWDIIWQKWRDGEIPVTWGSQELVVEPPEGWTWHVDDPEHSRIVTVTVKVIGLVLTAKGEANMYVLNDILDQKYDRAHIRTIFADNPTFKLTVVENEEEYVAATRPGGLANIVFESEKAPRIHILDKLYWPPTEKSISVIQQRVATMMSLDHPDWNTLQELTFEDLEGTDISAIWGKTWSGHPSSRNEDWSIKYPVDERQSPSTGRRPRINPKKKRRKR
jgi:hypothetical protein